MFSVLVEAINSLKVYFYFQVCVHMCMGEAHVYVSADALQGQ